MIRILLPFLIALFGVAHADQNDPLLDPLFDQLRNGGGDPLEIQIEIETMWMTAPEVSVQILVQRLTVALENEDAAVAGVLADHVTGLAPSFAQGWVLRGHAALLAEDLAAAEAAYTRAVSLEPRHYGALSALGDIAAAAGDKSDAHQFFRQALDFNPHLDAVRAQADQLRFELNSQEI